MRAAKRLEALFAGDIAAGVAGALAEEKGVPSLHTHVVGTVNLWN
jgi:hypothetical protein